MGRFPVPRSYGQSEQVVKCGKTDTAKQHERCQNLPRSPQSYRLDPTYRGH
jgi:hypothetical protein